MRRKQCEPFDQWSMRRAAKRRAIDELITALKLAHNMGAISRHEISVERDIQKVASLDGFVRSTVTGFGTARINVELDAGLLPGLD